ncbi:MAG: hypothetical protein AB1730_13545 [Myxococcota bacterium]|jgi:hypothetical protein
MKRVSLGLVAVFLSACGGPGSMDGTVAGLNLSVKDAIFALIKDANGTTQGMYLVLADKPDLCATVKANRQPKSLTGVVFSMIRYTDTGTVLAPEAGDYTVINMQPPRGGSYAGAFFTHTDANCTPTIAPTAATGSSGLVKLGSMKAEPGGFASGTFDVTFGTSDKVKGHFNASFCDVSTLGNNPNCE